MKCVLVLHNIRSVHNVGSLFRTADGAGVEKIILSGYTPTPLDQFGRPRLDFTKVSLGAEKTVAWEQVPSLAAALTTLKDAGYTIAALEQAPGSTPLFSYTPPERVALIVGNEVAGVAPETLALSDVILEIPLYGAKECLNVSVAGGIALFALHEKARQTGQ